jgi:hypothetical protein
MFTPSLLCLSCRLVLLAVGLLAGGYGLLPLQLLRLSQQCCCS